MMKAVPIGIAVLVILASAGVQGLFGIDGTVTNKGNHLLAREAACCVGLALLRAGGGSGGSAPPPAAPPLPPGCPVVEYSPESDSPPERALVLMDCFCPYHGVYLANRAISRYPGVAVVFTLSDYLRGYLSATEPGSTGRWEAARIPSDDQVDEWKSRIGSEVELVGVYCESDSGLADAEAVRQRLMVRCRDDPPISEARRHKHLMNEEVSQAGLRVAEQKLCGDLQEAQAFAAPFLNRGKRVVVKPYRGVATESVYLCDDEKNVADAWEKIVSTKVFGSQQQHSSVLVQECLTGTEYAVDVVSRDGHHKVAAIWRYDKRPANGAPFCYFRTELVDAEVDENSDAVVEYITASLSALGVRWGTSHNEVIVTDDGQRGPVLIEINCRQHNMDFCPLTMSCIGYNALDMTLDAFLGTNERWDEYPDKPKLRCAGCMVHLINYNEGTVVQTHHIDTISDLPSVLDFEIYSEFCTPGEVIKPTIDIRTDAGWVQLVNENRGELEDDYKKIVDLMPTMFQTTD